MLAGPFDGKQEYIDAQRSLACLLAVDRGDGSVTVSELNEAVRILWPHLSPNLQGALILR